MGSPPTEWLISRVCDEFHCVPSQAIRELERDPELVFEVMELRAYAQTKEQMDRAENQSDVPTGPMADLVGDIEVALFHERKARLTDGE